ncbi:hypothetical protein SEA_EASLEY_29 [Gordonia phage Easley]|uniref:Uncharacterized protein n=1 Tax=Gordonia phage Easley TaxID=2182395 RepID=A0A2U8UMU0_9CAUD|nr:hypothetical protein PP510_gp29 [Gordonia phage Easley]AWN05054.1 hypothetical protein SEA_EASLEY_29 [Gordonia phage Easley]URM87930.1 hypothetical protein SEA_WINKNICK_29 [Gordonia phage WinkNick]
MASNLQRIANHTDINVSVANNLITVPSNKQYLLKSLYLFNSRSDTLSITYSVYLVPPERPFNIAEVGAPAKTSLLWNQIIVPGELHTKEFNLLVMNPGDKLIIYTGSANGVVAHAHGLVIE